MRAMQGTRPKLYTAALLGLVGALPGLLPIAARLTRIG